MADFPTVSRSPGSTARDAADIVGPVTSWIADYLSAQKRAVEALDPAAIASLIQTLQTAWREDRQVFAIGNGGSAANASHFAVDLGKGASDVLPRRFRVLSLTDNLPWITAIGNDYAYEDIFWRQLACYARPGDVLIAASVSGNSPNLVRAFDWARQNGMKTMALVGAKRGRLAEISEQVLVIEDTHYGRVEDIQMHILHILCYAFWEHPEWAQG
jgi:D-sedoheptulose 7-phosphate isomerase